MFNIAYPPSKQIFYKSKILVGKIQSSRMDNNGAFQLGTKVSGVTVSLSATSGTVTCTFSAAALGGTSVLDVGRVITLDNGKQITITAYSSTTVCTGTVGTTLSGTGPFSDWTIAWPIVASYVAVAPSFGYTYLPANAIFTGSAAGFYYFTMSTTTKGIIFNNTLTLANNTPSVIASPTPFVCTGPGEFDSGGGTLVIFQKNLPGGLLGVDGRVDTLLSWLGRPNTSVTAYVNAYYGSLVYGQIAIPAGIGGSMLCHFGNEGALTTQRASGYAIVPIAGTTTAPFKGNLNSAVDQSITISVSPDNTHYCFLESSLIEVSP